MKQSGSKLNAFLSAGYHSLFRETSKVLYLGAGHGSSLKFLCNSVEVIYAVEIAGEPMQTLVRFAAKTDSVLPILGDARHPEIYASLLEEVDIIIEDISQPDQVGILCSNALFLKNTGIAIIFLKTRTIDTGKKKDAVLDDSLKELLNTNLFIRETLWLEPEYPDHAVIILEKK